MKLCSADVRDDPLYSNNVIIIKRKQDQLSGNEYLQKSGTEQAILFKFTRVITGDKSLSLDFYDAEIYGKLQWITSQIAAVFSVFGV